jgi:hypothetical protein
MIRDYIEVSDHMPLDALIEKLSEIRASLPPSAEAEMRIRGDDAFGRHLCIAYLRPLSPEEAACEARYAERGKARLRAAA